MLDDGVLTFTVLYNESGKAESRQVLDALASMQIAKTG